MEYPEIKALYEPVAAEILKRFIEEVTDEDCFVFGHGRWAIPDELLLRMSDRELAAWAQQNNVMFAQLKAHLAERFPEPEGKA